MAQRQQRPGDFTGTQKAKLAAEHAKAVADREGELSMMAEIEAKQKENQLVDYSAGPNAPLILDDEKTLEQANAELSARRQAAAGVGDDELEIDGAAVGTREAPLRTIMVNDKLEQVTIGVGNHYNFEPGVKYRVPAHVADHLEEKGYVYH